MAADTPTYGTLTDRVWQTAQRLQRFTAAELAHTIGERPKGVHQVLARRVKDGTLRREDRFYVVT